MTDRMKHERIRGRIRYTSKKPDMLGQVRGDEIFNITKHSDGKMTVRAHCEIHEPDPTVMRDIVYSTDENYNPMDCHVRLTVGDAFMGSGWFKFNLDENRSGSIECESYGPYWSPLSTHGDEWRVRWLRHAPDCWRWSDVPRHRSLQWAYTATDPRLPPLA